MVGSSKFSSVNYVDLFASNGVCCAIGEDGRPRRYAGSALLAAGCKKPFDNLFLVEKDESNLVKLSERISRLGCISKVHLTVGDANVVVSKIAQDIPERSLTIAFVDPYSLGIHFESVRTLASLPPLDLIIIFADAMDVARNVMEYYFPGKSDKLDNFLGKNSNWRDKWQAFSNQKGSSCKSRVFFAGLLVSTRQTRVSVFANQANKVRHGTTL